MFKLLSRLSVLSLCAATSVALTSQVYAQPEKAPQKVGVHFNKVYVPNGFDSNDIVQFVGEGMFSHLCYRPAETTVNVDHDTKTISVGPVAYVSSGFCLQVVLPFDRPVEVGILEPGSYTIVQGDTREVVGRVNVAIATTDLMDDFLYVPITQAFFRRTGSGKKQILLSGNFPSSCMSLQDVKVDVQPDVIVVQPIGKMQHPQGTVCKDGQFPFEKSIEVDNAKAGRYLLHVRTINGKAINNLIDIP